MHYTPPSSVLESDQLGYLTELPWTPIPKADFARFQPARQGSGSGSRRLLATRNSERAPSAGRHHVPERGYQMSAPSHVATFDSDATNLAPPRHGRPRR